MRAGNLTGPGQKEKLTSCQEEVGMLPASAFEANIKEVTNGLGVISTPLHNAYLKTRDWLPAEVRGN